MFLYILKRLAMMIPVLFFLTAVIFMLNELSPIDPARAVLGPSASPVVGRGAPRGAAASTTRCRCST